jgi:hypothetical protein
MKRAKTARRARTYGAFLRMTDKNMVAARSIFDFVLEVAENSGDRRPHLKSPFFRGKSLLG